MILHGRFSGHGRPRSWIASDIVRMQEGRLAEHWDVLQDEATAVDSKSGKPMFGASFALPDGQAAIADSSLTVEAARRIVAPLYDALNQPAKKDVAALLAEAANPDYRSFHTNENCSRAISSPKCSRGWVPQCPICTGKSWIFRFSVAKLSCAARRPEPPRRNSGEQSRPAKASIRWPSIYSP